MGDGRFDGDLRRERLARNAAESVSEVDEVADDRDGGGMTACSVTGKDDFSAVRAAGDDHVFRAGGPGQGRLARDEHGTDDGGQARGGLLGAGDLADSRVEFGGVGKIDGGDSGDGASFDLFGVNVDAHGQTHEDGELGARVITGDILGGIGLGIASVLGVGKNGGVVCAGLHGGEDEVAGAVQDALDAGDAVAGEAVLDAGNNRNATGDGGTEEQMAAVVAGKGFQFRAVEGDEFFVGSDDAPACGECATDPAGGRFQAADQFDEYIDASLAGKQILRMVCPQDRRRHPVGTLACDVAVGDGGKLQSCGCVFDEDARDGASDGAEANESNAQGMSWGGERGGDGRRVGHAGIPQAKSSFHDKRRTARGGCLNFGSGRHAGVSMLERAMESETGRVDRIVNRMRTMSRGLQWFCAAAVCAGLVTAGLAQIPGNTGTPATAGAQTAVGMTAQSGAGQNAGQNNATQPGSDQGFKIVRNVNEVNLIFTVTDRHGAFIPNLRLSDFALLDDQKAPERVTSFTQQTNLPLRVGLVIDASTSIRQRFDFEKQSATQFLLQVLRSRADRAFVMAFDATPTLEQDWTDNIDALETGVNKLRPGGSTALYDAVYEACQAKQLSQTRGQEPVRRAIVVISDGNDNQSRVYIDEAIKMCERAETIIYAISTNWTPSRGRGDDSLRKMAEATGGRAFFPPSMEDMVNGFNSISEELRSQYLLTYTPADFKSDGAFRTIYLYCLDRRYHVRAKKGYFAPRE